MTSLIVTQVERERAIERIVNLGRLAGAGLVVVQFGLLGSEQPPGIVPAGLLVGLGFLLVSAVSHRRLRVLTELDDLRRLTTQTLVLDTALLGAMMLLLTHENDPLNVLLLVIAVIEGAMKRQFRGAMSTAVAVSGVEITRLLLRVWMFDAGFRSTRATYIAGMMAIVGLFVGGVSRLLIEAQEALARTNDRIQATHRLLRTGLASFAAGSGTRDVVEQAVASLSIDAAVVVSGDEELVYPAGVPDPPGRAVLAVTDLDEGPTPVPTTVRDLGDAAWLALPLPSVDGQRSAVFGLIRSSSGLEDLLALQSELAALARAERAASLEQEVLDSSARLARLRQEFVAITHHEMRTPVTVIRAAAETLRSRSKDAEAERLWDALDRGTSRLMRMVDDLAILQRLDGGGLGVQRGEVGIRELVDRCLAATLPAGSTGVETSVPDDLAADTDSDLAERVLGALVDNALTHAEGRDLTISARRSGERVLIDVRDGGPGVPPEARERIFERFTAADVSRHGRGAGLGLPLARDLARLMGGDVTLVDDQATVFRVELPAADTIRLDAAALDLPDHASLPEPPR